MCTISKDIGTNKEEEICLPNKESINGHKCERIGMDAKCEMFMNCSKTSYAFAKKQIWLPNKEYLRDHRCGKTFMAY